MNLTILDTGLSRTDPYVIIDENEKVLAASYEENGEHSKAGLLRLTGEIATLRAQLAAANEARAKAEGESERLRLLCAAAAQECKKLRMNCLAVGIIPFNGPLFDETIDRLQAAAALAESEEAK